MSDNTKESAGAKNTVVNEDYNDWDVWHGACAKNASRSDDKVKKVAANNKELLLANMYPGSTSQSLIIITEIYFTLSLYSRTNSQE
jgi:hypothetical protein